MPATKTALPLIVLIRDLYDLPGGYGETVKGTLAEMCSDEKDHLPKLEGYVSRQAFLERELFNRNTLASVVPDAVFASGLSDSPELRRLYRICWGEFGSPSVDVIAPGMPESLDIAKVTKQYQQSALRLSEKSSQKIIEAFNESWPPTGYDAETVERLERELAMFGSGVFDEAAASKVVEEAKAELGGFNRLQPGKAAFRDLLLRERFQQTVLYNLPLWEDYDQVMAIIDHLVEAFSSLLYNGSLISAFKDAASDALSSYLDWNANDAADADGSDCLDGYIDSVAGAFEKLRRTCQEPYREIVDRVMKATLIYNVVVPAVYGPGYANSACYMKRENAGTLPVDRQKKLCPEVDPTIGPNRGDVVIRETCRTAAHKVADVNIDSYTDESPDHLVCIVGREYGGEVREILPDGDPVVQAATRMVPGENEGNFYPCVQAGVSQRHMGFYVHVDRLWVVDLGSTNGTLVRRIANGQLEEHLLKARRSDSDRPSQASMMLQRGDVIVVSNAFFQVI